VSSAKQSDLRRTKAEKKKFLCNQVINTPTLTLPHPEGGNFGSPSISPPLAGGGWGEGDKKGNSYAIKLSLLKRTPQIKKILDIREKAW